MLPRCFFALLSAAILYFNYTYFEPVSAIYLTSLGYTEVTIGLFFAIYPSFYVCGCLLYSIMPRGVEKRLIIMVALFVFGLGNFMAGPAQLFPNSFTLMCCGQAVLGVAGACMLVPTFAEIIEAVQVRRLANEKTVTYVASGMFNTVLATG